MERRNIERLNMKRRRGNELKARITRNRKQRDENLNRKKILKNRAHFTAMISIKIIRLKLDSRFGKSQLKTPLEQTSEHN